ncbi:hypothetical protein [Streptomyces sp. NPDC017890]|uniref:hypothetical protein n=1 Tax=Streptomyces sp. NPDC017890 TaxID=3365015 RepID=UPI003797C603
MPALVSLALDQGLNLLGTALDQWLLVALLAAAAAGTRLYRRSRATPPEPPRVRRFTLLRTEDADGTPVR